MAKRKVQYIGVTSEEPYFMGLIYDFFADIEDFTVTPTKTEVLSMFTSADSNEFPHFSVSYNGIVFDVGRTSKSGLSSGYYLRANTSGVQDTTYVSNIVFLSTGFSPTYETTRQCTLEVVYGANILAIIPQYSSQIPGIILFFKDENSNIFYCARTMQSSGNWKLSTVGFHTNATSVEYKIAPVCSYTVGVNQIDMYDYIILKRGSDAEKISVIHSSDIFYCSPVTRNKILTIDNKKYKSVATDCVVQIEEGNN